MIGAHWQIDTDHALSPAQWRLADRVDEFDRTWTRFRSDSLVNRLPGGPARWSSPARRYH